MASPQTRARYWARSFAGWHDFSRIKPNSAHESLARLQQRGWVDGIITQAKTEVMSACCKIEVKGIERRGKWDDLCRRVCQNAVLYQLAAELLPRLSSSLTASEPSKLTASLEGRFVASLGRESDEISVTRLMFERDLNSVHHDVPPNSETV